MSHFSNEKFHDSLNYHVKCKSKYQNVKKKYTYLNFFFFFRNKTHFESVSNTVMSTLKKKKNSISIQITVRDTTTRAANVFSPRPRRLADSRQ